MSYFRSDKPVMNTLFPIFLKTDQLHTLVVGGGEIGIEKVQTLLANDPDAKITVVAKEIRPEIRILAAGKPNVRLITKAFQASDVDRKDIVIGATADQSLNLLVWQKAKQAEKLVNIADTPLLCDFYLSSVVRKDDLKIAISSNGKSPTLTKRIRQFLEEALPDGTQNILNNLQVIRSKIKGDFKTKLEELEEVTNGMVN